MQATIGPAATSVAETDVTVAWTPGQPLAATIVEADNAQADALSTSSYLALLKEASARLAFYAGEFEAAMGADEAVRS